MTTDVAILSCGPSLSVYLRDRPAHQVTIGVNRAVVAVECDYWAFRDCKTMYIVEDGLGGPLGHPSCIAPARCAQNVQAYRPPKGLRFIAEEEIVNEVGPHNLPTTIVRWRTFSVTWAVALMAQWLKPKTLTVYGHDMEGWRYWNGIHIAPDPSRFNPGRWKKEQDIWNVVSGWVQCQGVAVRRILCEHSWCDATAQADSRMLYVCERCNMVRKGRRVKPDSPNAPEFKIT